jgi:hypothetical protein
MARRIYSILIAISLILGVLLFVIKETYSKNFLIVISSLIFMFFSMGIHGLIAHSLKPSIKGDGIVYPLLMGALWGVLFFLFVFFIIPIFCPGSLPSPMYK